MIICNVQVIAPGIFLEFKEIKILWGLMTDKPWKSANNINSRRLAPDSENYVCPQSSTGGIHVYWEGCHRGRWRKVCRERTDEKCKPGWKGGRSRDIQELFKGRLLINVEKTDFMLRTVKKCSQKHRLRPFSERSWMSVQVRNRIYVKWEVSEQRTQCKWNLGKIQLVVDWCLAESQKTGRHVSPWQ